MSTDRYTQNLKNEYGSLMTGFPDINQEAVNAIADYIKSETARPGAFEEEIRFFDSLSKTYRPANLSIDTGKVAYSPSGIKMSPDSEFCKPVTIYMPEPSVQPTYLDTNSSIDPPTDTTTIADLSQPADAASMESLRSGFNDYNPSSGMYNFTIKTLGWYNVDYFVTGYPGTSVTKVNVIIKNEEETGMVNLYLFCPRNKMLSVGQPKWGKPYSFDKINGGIPLFLQDRAILFAFTSMNEKVYYAIKEFTVQPDQDFVMTMKESSKNELLTALKRKQIEGIEIELTKKEKKTIYYSCNSVTDTVKANTGFSQEQPAIRQQP